MSSSSPSGPPKFHAYPAYALRFWHGMRSRVWWNLLRSNHFAVSPSRLHMAIALTFSTPINDVLGGLQRWRHERRIRETDLQGPPIFILGHWRSGTTLLHELMLLDARNSCPTTFQCFAPNHFLVSEWFFRRFGKWLLPAKRPMDNMLAGWERPQEDEFALMSLGLPSPYRRIAFPRNPPPDLDYLDFRGVSVTDIDRWLDGLESFLRAVSYAHPGRLVLKSPTHTGRLGVLARKFPGAKFIHITRDPRDLFPSTRRLWLSLDHAQALQSPPDETDREYVLTCFERMYEAFHRDRLSVPKESLIDIRYEDLVADPATTLRSAYDQLALGDFGSVETPLKNWIQEHHRGYKTNAHHLPPEDEAEIRKRWGEYFSRYDYA